MIVARANIAAMAGSKRFGPQTTKANAAMVAWAARQSATNSIIQPTRSSIGAGAVLTAKLSVVPPLCKTSTQCGAMIATQSNPANHGPGVRSLRRHSGTTRSAYFAQRPSPTARPRQAQAASVPLSKAVQAVRRVNAQNGMTPILWLTANGI